MSSHLRTRDLASDIAVTLAALAIGAAGKTAYSLVVARAVGPVALGDSTAILTLAMLLSLLAAAGTGPAATRALSSARALGDQAALRRVARRATIATVVGLGAIAALVGWLYSYALGRPWFGWNLALVTMTYGLYQFFRAFDYGVGRVRAYAWTEVSANAVLAGTAVLVVLGRDWLLVPCLLAFATFTVVAGLRAVRVLRLKHAPAEPAGPGDFWVYAGTNFVSTLASMGSLQASVIVAREGFGGVDAGLFAAAYALLVPLLYLPRAVGTSLLPRAAAATASGRDGRGEVAEGLWKLTLALEVVALPIVLLLSVASREVLRLTTGPAYEGAADELRLLLLSSYFLIVCVPAVNALSAGRKRDFRVPLLWSAVGLVVAGAIWAVGITAGFGVRVVAVGVLAGTVTKALPTMLVGFRRHLLPVAHVLIGVGAIASFGVVSFSVPGAAASAAVAAAVLLVHGTACLRRLALPRLAT